MDMNQQNSSMDQSPEMQGRLQNITHVASDMAHRGLDTVRDLSTRSRGMMTGMTTRVRSGNWTWMALGFGIIAAGTLFYFMRGRSFRNMDIDTSSQDLAS